MTDEEGVDQQQVAEAAPDVQEDPQERNWRETNRILKEQKAAIDRLAREKEELAAMMQQFVSQPQQQEEDEELDVYSPDFGKRLEKKLEKAVLRTYETIESKKKSDPAYIEEQARRKYSDFDQVMSSDHIDEIIKANPIVHKAVMSSPNPIEAAYEFIRSSAAYQQKSSAKTVSQQLISDDRKRLSENQSKPKAAASIPRSSAMSSIPRGRRLTPEERAAINADTDRIIRGG